jgi:hypothetical protein
MHIDFLIWLTFILDNIATAHCGKENKSSHITGKELLRIAVWYFEIWQEIFT